MTRPTETDLLILRRVAFALKDNRRPLGYRAVRRGFIRAGDLWFHSGVCGDVSLTIGKRIESHHGIVYRPTRAALSALAKVKGGAA